MATAEAPEVSGIQGPSVFFFHHLKQVPSIHKAAHGQRMAFAGLAVSSLPPGRKKEVWRKGRRALAGSPSSPTQ